MIFYRLLSKISCCWGLAPWSTQSLSTYMSTQSISWLVDMIFNMSTEEQWKYKTKTILIWEAAMSCDCYFHMRMKAKWIGIKVSVYNPSNFLFWILFRRVFQLILKLKLCLCACQCRDKNNIDMSFWKKLCWPLPYWGSKTILQFVGLPFSL